ncbi:DUF2855 family protein [Alteromonas halophila]|uniref:DUF2855 family protein n=1 Tax=Alteromonas halophila TaxID=516698 RepID=A0A918JM05_9ALTE|nr:DUF2855 family protein [Alteromonas halophila]GGW89034.1 hypothetical protein GCM10007391_24020 [Alteromonas halophila]
MPRYTQTQLLIDKQHLDKTRLEHNEISSDTLGEGEVLLRISDFGLSANNITYAVLGKMGYWGFFPGGKNEGIMPVWGFADIIASEHPQLEVGERLYGYLPFASHLVVRPDNVDNYSFVDTHPERKSIHPVYDRYTRCSADPAYDPDNEAWQMAFRPLFMTSFVLDESVSVFSDHDIVITSASSKTASGTACLLAHNRRQRQSGYRIVGITSAANRSFTESLGFYDSVVTYDDITAYEGNAPIIVLDFAGNSDVLFRLQAHCAEKFRTLWMIGATDWDARSGGRPDGVDASLFFAPEHVSKLQSHWGTKQFMQRYADAWKTFSENVLDQYHVTRLSADTAAQKTYLALLNGSSAPDDILIMQWQR